MTGTRSLTRLAWRDARRDRWRSLLIVVLVAMPVAGLGAAVTLFDTIAASPEERARDILGQADARIDGFGPTDGEIRDEVERRVPDGTKIEIRSFASDELLLPAQRVPVRLTDSALEGDALSVGRYRLLDGRAPGDAEVALTRRLLETTDLAIGDRVAFEGLGEVEVVGEALNREVLDDRRVIVAAGSLEDPAAPVEVDHREALVAFPSMHGDAASFFLDDGNEAVAPEWGFWTREEILTSRFTDGQRTVAVVVGGLAAVEVALIVGAAFAVSVRRRQRELGLLAAAGATTRHVRRVVLLTGGTAGVIGAVLGTVLGLIAMVVATPWLDMIAGREVAGLRIDPLWLLLVAALGIASTLAGAWWPARSVARLPITVALSGRRPSPSPSVRGLRAGIGLALVAVTVLALSVFVHGTALAWVFLAGSVLLVLAVGLSSPWLLEQLGRLAPRLPAGPRLALRDAARFRTRNGPVLTAAMAGLAASITVVTIATSVERSSGQELLPHLEAEVMQIQGAGHAPAAEAIAAELGADHVAYGLTDIFVANAAEPWVDGVPSALLDW
jgi:putative ABC transport system permease protein